MRKLLRRSVELSLVLLLVGTASTLTWGRAEALSLNIALEAPEDIKVRQTGDVFEKVASLLTARGHTVTVVSGADLDTASKIGAYDVVVLTGSGFYQEYDWELFEGQVEGYVNGGGGLVSSGWGIYMLVSGVSAPYPGIALVLPFNPNPPKDVLGDSP